MLLNFYSAAESVMTEAQPSTPLCATEGKMLVPSWFQDSLILALTCHKSSFCALKSSCMVSCLQRIGTPWINEQETRGKSHFWMPEILWKWSEFCWQTVLTFHLNYYKNNTPNILILVEMLAPKTVPCCPCVQLQSLWAALQLGSSFNILLNWILTGTVNTWIFTDTLQSEELETLFWNCLLIPLYLKTSPSIKTTTSKQKSICSQHLEF